MKIVYYESIKREPKIRGIYECRCEDVVVSRRKGRGKKNRDRKMWPPRGMVLMVALGMLATGEVRMLFCALQTFHA
jgi:hypothetical protein